MNGNGLATDGRVADHRALDGADRDEASAVRRFVQLSGLRQTVDEAARRADAASRLEIALHLAARRAA